jgi:hypothetical protein
MSTAIEINASEFADSVSAAWAHMVAANRRPPAPHAHVYASSWRSCVRRMVYDMTSPDQVQPWSPDTLANFQRGNDRERELLIDLARVGRAHNPSFEVIGQQERFELRDLKGRTAIVGKVDARIKCGGMSAPIETKSWNPNTVARIRSFNDVFLNPWTRSGGYQLLSYLYGSNEPIGFLLLDRYGLPLMLPVVLFEHLDKVEDFLRKAEIALDHVQAKTVPDFHRDPGECKKCPYFGTVCQPPIKHEGAQVLTDPGLIEMLEQRAELEDAADKFDALDKEIKARLRGVESGIAGSFVLSGKWQRQTVYKWPEDLKREYGRVEPRGKFILTITKA